MIYDRRRSHRPRRSDPVIVHHHGTEIIAAIVTAASLVARADGHVAPDERRALLAFLRERGILARSGRRRVVDAFDRAAEGRGRRDGDDLTDALDAVSLVASRPSAWLAVAAAQRVAMSDGIVWPQEAAMIAILRDRLGLRSGPPVDFGA